MYSVPAAGKLALQLGCRCDWLRLLIT